MEVQVNIKDRILKPVSEVFEAIVKPDHLAGFFVSAASGPIEQGVAVTWRFDDVGAIVSASIKEVRANELILFEWTASGINTRVTIRLEAVGSDLTSVAITEDGWALDKHGVTRALQQTQGWTDFLCSLKAFLYTGINLRDGRTRDIH
ncbi:MAG: SRPBCC domain-containing protein [Ignavibacteria bacterium]|nr:SRPBCC domain-containing protein [Ignavibacteria bacterium]